MSKKKLSIIIVILVILFSLVVGLAIVISIQKNKLNDRIIELENELENKKIEYASGTRILEEQIVGLEYEMKEQESVNEEKVLLGKEAIYNQIVGEIQEATGFTSYEDLCNVYLQDQYKVTEYESKLSELNSVIEDLVNKIEKYEHYEYAFFDTTGKKNDLSIEDIELLETLLENEYANDVDLYLAWIMIESEGYAKCKNSNSTAKGLSQFLDGTSKNVYSKLNYTDAWYPEIVFNKEICLTMMVKYVNDLIEDYHGDLHKAINSYRGLYDAPYLRAFDRYLAKNGKSIDSIALTVAERYDNIKRIEHTAVG